jgi:hypothetical protein
VLGAGVRSERAPVPLGTDVGSFTLRIAGNLWAVIETVRHGDPATGHSAERRETASEKRIASLFRRWEILDESEVRELRELWGEHLQRAKRKAQPRPPDSRFTARLDVTM